MADERDDFNVSTIASTLQSAVEKLSANIEQSIISSSMASAKIITDSINSSLTGLKSNIDSLSSAIQENPSISPSNRERVRKDPSDPFNAEYSVEADVKVSIAKLEKEVELKIESDPEKKSLAKEYSKKEEKLKEAQASTRQFISDQSDATRALKQFGNPLIAAIIGGINNWQINNKKIALASQVLDTAQAELKISEVRTKLLNEGIRSEIEATQNKISEISGELDSRMGLAAQIDDEIITKTKSIREIESENQIIQEKMQVNGALIQGLQSGVDLAKQDYAASKDNIILLEQKKAAESSQISAINEQIRELEVRGEFKGRGMTDEQRSEIAKANAEKVQALQLEKEGLLAAFNETKKSIQAEKSRRDGIESELGMMQSELDSSLAAQNEYEEILKRNSDSLDAARSELDVLTSAKDQYGQMINSSKAAIDKLTEKIGLLESEVEKNNKSLQAKREAVDKARKQLENAKTKKYADAIGDVRRVLTILTKYLNAVVKEVRDLQKQLGITAGSAAKIKFEVLMQSISSYVKALAGATPVSRKEIETAISDFRSEFGGLISTKEATELAKEAKAMGLTTQQLAAARRVFMTQTMGDLSSAQREQDRFIKVFTQQGMTSKDAMEFIGKNSELLARSGVRFQQSMARAAAEAKKIGVDLSKVNQVGDNIIGNFEGFLESMAELGAMGFGFDASRLAEVAERGDTSALFDELRSQLRVTGRDLTDLTRSQQLSLSNAFGMGIEDFQRLAGLTPDIGEAETETETGLLSKIVNILEGVAGTLGLVNRLLSVIHTGLLTQIAINTGGFARLFGRGGTFGRAGGRGRGARIGTRARVIGRRTGVVGRGGRISTSPMAQNISRVIPKNIGGFKGVGRGIPLLGTALALGGSALEFKQISNAQKSGQISDQEARKQRAGATGSVSTGLAGGFAGAKVGAAIGTFGGPIGIAAGSIIGGTLGYLAGSSVGRKVGEVVGEAFNKVSSTFQSAVDGIGNRLSKWKDAISGASESIKNLIGGMLKSLVNGIKNIVTAPFKLAKKAGNKVGSLLGMGTRSIGSDLDISGSGDIEPGDDVISKPGYGDRSLVTPQKTIALNNDDNIVAYADDMISTNTGIELLSKGALVDKADKSSPEIKVDVDLGKLERKLDQVVSAITSMKVEMDAQKVGRIVADSEQKSSTMGIFQTQRIG